MRLRFGTPGAPEHAARGRVVDGAAEGALDATVRRAMAAKYQGWHAGQPLGEWGRTALVVEARPADLARWSGYRPPPSWWSSSRMSCALRCPSAMASLIPSSLLSAFLIEAPSACQDLSPDGMVGTR